MKRPKNGSHIFPMLDELGLVLVSFKMGGAGHPKFVVKAQDGRTMMFTTSATPSDYRTTANCKARLRRFAENRLRETH